MLQQISRLLFTLFFRLMSIFIGRFREKAEFPDGVLCSRCGTRFSEYASECPHCYDTHRPTKRKSFHSPEMSEEELAEFMQNRKGKSSEYVLGDTEVIRFEKTFTKTFFSDDDSDELVDFGELDSGEQFSKTVIEIDGKKYHSLDELPPEYRCLFQDKNNNNIPDQFEKLLNDEQDIKVTSSKTVIQYNGKTYNSLNELPADVRKMFEDKDNNGTPDKFE